MAVNSWEPVVETLKLRTTQATEAQIALAKKLELAIPDELPSRVYAALVRMHTAEELWLRSYDPPTENQLQWISTLSSELDFPVVGPIPNKSIAAAWIKYFYDVRAQRALEVNKFVAGDIVELQNPTRPAEISSIGMDGTLYFRGGGGNQARAHRATVVARAGDVRQGPGSPHYQAAQAAARHRPVRTEIGEERLRDIADWRVDVLPTYEDVLMFEEVLETATNERPLQELLAERPQLLAPAIGDHHWRFVVSQPRLAGEFVPDFIVGGLNSLGLIWTPVEIESPNARVVLNNGGPAEKMREAERQIQDWRRWLMNNLDYARKARSLGGVGLIEIRPKPKCLILIGRTDSSLASADLRQPMLEDQNILVHSYDWLLSLARDAQEGRHVVGDRRLFVDLDD